MAFRRDSQFWARDRRPCRRLVSVVCVLCCLVFAAQLAADMAPQTLLQRFQARLAEIAGVGASAAGTADEASWSYEPMVDAYELVKDSVPRWVPPERFAGKLVSAFVSGRMNGGWRDPMAWARSSRVWRRGIPAVITTFEKPPEDEIAESARHGESWVEWNASSLPTYGGKAHEALFALTPALALEAIGANSEFEWMLFGDDDTVFNLDVVVDIVRDMDPTVPHLVTDHMWHNYTGAGPHEPFAHGSPMAPRCVKCGVRAGPVPGHPDWRPPQACPACTWELIRQSDPQRPEIYAGPNGFNATYLPDGELIAHGGAGMLLSRALVDKLTVPYMRRCLEKNLSGAYLPGGDTAFSHCVFFLGVAPTDPGPFAKDADTMSFGPVNAQTKTAFDDAYAYSKGFDCCDDACQKRLAATASVHLRTIHFRSAALARDAVAAIQRSRDIYRYAQMLVRQKKTTNTYGGWDGHVVCQ